MTDRTGLRLAIVEDEVILAMALTLMLEGWGHHVVGTADTEEGAVALVQAERPHAIVMDIRLGRADSGLRAARLIRACSDVAIVFCTACSDSESVQAEVRGIDNAHLLGKPVDEDQLELLLRRIAASGDFFAPDALGHHDATGLQRSASLFEARSPILDGERRSDATRLLPRRKQR